MIGAGGVPQVLHLLIPLYGLTSTSRLMFCTSKAMTENEVTKAVTAMSRSLGELRPYIEKDRPQLLQ